MNHTLKAHYARMDRERRRRAVAQGVILLALIAAWLLMTSDMIWGRGAGKREGVIGVSGVVGGVHSSRSSPTAYLLPAPLRIATEDYARTGNRLCA